MHGSPKEHVHPQVWVAPGSGTVLCADEHYSNAFGIANEDLVGRPFSSLGSNMPELDRWGTWKQLVAVHAHGMLQ